MSWEAAGLTDRGRIRPNNEDALLLLSAQGIFGVADGMGGHAAGEVASALAIDALRRAFSSDNGIPTGDQVRQRLLDTVRTANREIQQKGEEEPGKTGMGTTLTVLGLVAGGRAWSAAHVGDSRLYLLRNDRLQRLSADHTWIEEKVREGQLDRSAAKHHPWSNVLTRALGVDPEVRPDLLGGDTQVGDLFLLCTDGLNAVLEDGEIQRILLGSGSLEDTVRRLVDAANAAGGPDNTTVVLVRVGPLEAESV